MADNSYSYQADQQVYHYGNNNEIQQQQQQQQPTSFEQEFWQERMNEMEQTQFDFKLHQLPLARIKKVMKSDQDVKMISAEAPILFSKGCDVFITELTLRAWKHAVENKRRTLQRSDIAVALSKSDMFDFLIDIVPREEASSATHTTATNTTTTAAASVDQTAYAPYQYGNYGYGLPHQAQYIMNETQQQQIYMQQQQQQQQQQLMNEQMYKQPNNDTN